MPLEIQLKPVETLLFRSDLVAVGKFRCPATHPLFRDSGPCSHHTFVFPRTRTRIQHDGGPTFLGSPGSVAFYNQHQRYGRTKVSEIDASDWLTVADDMLLELVGAHDRRATPERPFSIAEGPCDSETFLAQRMIFETLERGEVDALAVEESVLRVLRRVVTRVYGRAAHDPTRDADAVRWVRMRIAADPSRVPSLRALAASCELSPFRLCRAFRAHTGETITAYRQALRLRLALERLRDRTLDLTDLALDLGYSSHSHFTYSFRRQFGVTPSRFRATVSS